MKQAEALPEFVAHVREADGGVQTVKTHLQEVAVIARALEARATNPIETKFCPK